MQGSSVGGLTENFSDCDSPGMTKPDQRSRIIYKGVEKFKLEPRYGQNWEPRGGISSKIKIIQSKFVANYLYPYKMSGGLINELMDVVCATEFINFFEGVIEIFTKGITDPELAASVYTESKDHLASNILKLDLVRFRIEEIILKYCTDLDQIYKTPADKQKMQVGVERIIRVTNLYLETKVSEY
jgi:hypothetical protein